MTVERQDRLQSLYSLTHCLTPNVLSSANPGSHIASYGVEAATKRRSMYYPNVSSGYLLKLLLNARERVKEVTGHTLQRIPNRRRETRIRHGGVVLR